MTPPIFTGPFEAVEAAADAATLALGFGAALAAPDAAELGAEEDAAAVLGLAGLGAALAGAGLVAAELAGAAVPPHAASSTGIAAEAN
ncbi:MAG: hypothetical protein JO247_08580 [Chloroflexi bacterium]|nr:hypothetical protein [Chloroflexota bacterium]